MYISGSWGCFFFEIFVFMYMYLCTGHHVNTCINVDYGHICLKVTDLEMKSHFPKVMLEWVTEPGAEPVILTPSPLFPPWRAQGSYSERLWSPLPPVSAILCTPCVLLLLRLCSSYFLCLEDSSHSHQKKTVLSFKVMLKFNFPRVAKKLAYESENDK